MGTIVENIMLKEKGIGPNPFMKRYYFSIRLVRFRDTMKNVRIPGTDQGSDQKCL
jgi:hypothetical protein